jgi:hypothetical protein
MIAEALTALAAAGGSAVVQAAGTDAWEGIRRRVAKLLGRGDARREQTELDRLDQTAKSLRADTGEAAQGQRARQEAAWQTRFEMLLEGLDEPDQSRAVAELQALISAAAGRAAGVSGNTFNGPAAFMAGHCNIQENRFGTGHERQPG